VCPEFEDCSSFVTWCYFAAGAPDPNGLGYNGFGYTGTQIAHGQEKGRPRPGDLVFYGPSRSAINHVTLYVGNGRVISHGQETGPQLLPMDYGRGSLGGRQQIRTYLP
jgi:cell wall-associated NlpC family hydrolase